MSYDLINAIIDKEIQWRQDNKPDLANLTEKENEVLQKGFIQGLATAKSFVNQARSIDEDCPVEAIEEMICIYEDKLTLDDLELFKNLFNQLLINKVGE